MTGEGVVLQQRHAAFSHSTAGKGIEGAVQVKQGDRIAQLILERILIADVAEVDELDDTVRGAGGIGSTGGFGGQK